MKIISATKNPISFIGECSSICYNSSNDDKEKVFNRGLMCIKQNHGETSEFVDLIFETDEYSARCLRELLRHRITTKLQASTRYVNYDNMDYYIPDSIRQNEKAWEIYEIFMENVKETYKKLLNFKVPKEDVANILPLGMKSKVIFKCTLREWIHICSKRGNKPALLEIQDLVRNVNDELIKIDDEWKTLINWIKKEVI
jgi:thymidylate synthase (FAD)